MTEQRAFEVGDLVELKSGGPIMTVKERFKMGDNDYRCQWFAGKKLESGIFPYDSLKAAKTGNGK